MNQKPAWPVLLVSLLLAAPSALQAQFNYTTNADGVSLTITGYTGSGGAVSIPTNINGLAVTCIGDDAFFDTTVTSVTIPDSVTRIGDLGFYDSTNLTSVMIPSSVTNIGPFAFYGCYSLASVMIPSNVTSIEDATFYNCTSLTNATIGNGVTTIDDLAFYECSSLVSVTIPSSVTSIGDRAFGYCTNLTMVNFQGNAPSFLGVDVFYGDSATVNYLPRTTGWGSMFGGLHVVLWNPPIPFNYIINDETITITKYTGSNEEVIIPGTINFLSVTSIGSGAFQRDANLTNVTIPNSVTSIGAAAFSSTSLANVTIPNGVTNIGGTAFGWCSLINVTIPDSVTSMGDDVFYECFNLTSVIIGNGVTSIGEDTFAFCPNLTSVTIGTNVTSMAMGAFENCFNLTGITIPNNITNIGYTAFINCCSLTNLTIGNSLTSIGGDTFPDCSSLTSITIGNSVTKIGDYAFQSCPLLSNVYFEGNAPNADSSVFDGENPTVYYLPGSSGWSEFSANTGISAVPWNPSIQTADGSFGIQSNQFGFNITGTNNFTVVVQACTDLACPVWTPLQTLTLTNGSCYFSEALQTTNPARFYALGMP